ncbi:hypothetical protein ACQPZF_03570 [Actinosynnema sp. CS-041913]|uniref:hypothetical protein n=1 Tax=Actinosynnema sp. CS-041913 TaxID=3239917 RepID=UPI003D8E6249
MSETKVLLIDVENVVGPVNPSPELVRARVGALLEAAGPVHHVMAGYSRDDSAKDCVVSVLAEMGVPTWVVPRGTDAAEKALLTHARYAHDRGCRSFVVASGDHRFTELKALGAFEVLVWQEQKVAVKLNAAARAVRRVPRPAANGSPTSTPFPHVARPPLEPRRDSATLVETVDQDRGPSRSHTRLPMRQVINALTTGAGIAVTHLLIEHLVNAVRRVLR